MNNKISKEQKTDNSMNQEAVDLAYEARDHLVNNNLSAAAQSYENSLQVYRKLAKNQPSHYQINVVIVLTNLGTIWFQLHEYLKARDIFQEAQQYLDNLVQVEGEVYLPKLAKVVNNLASSYRHLLDYEAAKQAYEKAIIIYNQLITDTTNKYLADQAMAISNLANIHYDLHEYTAARMQYEKAISIRRQLAKTDPETHAIKLATTLDSLACLKNALNENDIARKLFEEALNIRRNLIEEQSPIQLRLDIATGLNNLAILYGDMKLEANAKTTYREVIKLLNQIEKFEPATVVPYRAKVFSNYSSFLHDLGNTTKAIEYCQKALNLKIDLSNDEPKVYLPSLAISYNNLGNFHCARGDIEQAHISYMKAIACAENPAITNKFRYLVKTRLHTSYRYLLKEAIEKKDYLKAFSYSTALRGGQIKSGDISKRDLLETQNIIGKQIDNDGLNYQIIVPTIGIDGELLVGLITSSKLRFLIAKKNSWDQLNPPKKPRYSDNIERNQLARNLWNSLPKIIQEILTSAIENKTHILICGDPFWNEFPWELLCFGSGKLDYLGLHQVLPRIGAIHAKGLKAQFSNTRLTMERRSVAVFAPYDSDSSKPLLGAIVETNTIKNVIEKYDASKLVAFDQGKAADDQAFSRQLDLQPDVLYFSGHGMIKDNEEYLKLHSSDNERSISYMGRQELRNLSMESTNQLFPNNPLIVLNSCVTGRSRTAGGEREDLVATFIELGAGTVIASPIPINDMVSKAFGEALFHHLMEVKTTTGNAILEVRQNLAQNICADLSSPFWGVWAMIHLHGNSTT